MLRSLAFLAALAAAPLAGAQVQVQAGATPAVEVQRLAPQLVGFFGGNVNFTNLVNGLALGVPVTLSTPISAGATQVVSFTPAATMTPLQIAQTLEAARQSLIGRGIAAPTAEQIGIALTGGTLPTAFGQVPVTPVVPATAAASTVANPPSPATALQQGQVGPGVTVRNMSDSPFPRGISDTSAPGTASVGVPAPVATPTLPAPFVGGVTANPGQPAAAGSSAPRLGVGR